MHCSYQTLAVPEPGAYTRFAMARVYVSGVGVVSPLGFGFDSYWNALVAGRSAADEVVKEIAAAGGRAIAYRADMGNPADIPPLFDAAMSEFRRLDILVNNAAVMQRTFLEEVTPELFNKHFDVNVRGYLLACKEAAARMTAGGCVINVASAISRMAYPGAVVYTATKGAVDVMTRVLAMELGPRGIRVNVIAPGSTITDMNSAASGRNHSDCFAEAVSITAISIGTTQCGTYAARCNARSRVSEAQPGWEITAALLRASPRMRSSLSNVIQPQSRTGSCLRAMRCAVGLREE